jgi:DNA polymerase-3 subunit gamma/tau
MNPFVVSARKYRPATFDTVVGQSHITTTLKNAIRTKHLAQAFLFCGPRGVGKTTCARILAKTLNCKQQTADIEACNQCESCISFQQSQSLNIYELDAASNNSVDDIRSLVEQVRYAPHAGEFKIYIIDEVHMLSSGAFNAFLKTLEEPPPYAIFILATTEKHKIIPTILSRCQIFDFNRIQVDDIAKHLEYVSGKEGIQAEEDALHIIAQKADGALRDALSIFDQIVSFAGTTLTYKSVIDNLSILDYDYYFRVTDEIRQCQLSSALLTLNELLADGFDGHHFITGLASHFRDLLVSQDPATLVLLEVSKLARERYRIQASEIPRQHLLRYISICAQCDLDYKSSRNQRLHVELCLMRLCAVSGGQSQDVSTTVDFDKAPSPASIQPGSRPSVAPTQQPTQTKTISPAASAQASPSAPAPQKSPALPTAQSPVAPPPSPLPSSHAGSVFSGASLSALKKNTAPTVQEAKPIVAENASAVRTEMPDSPFQFDQFLQCWNRYAAKVREEGKLQLFTTMTMNAPKLLDDVTAQLVIHNPSQGELIQEEKTSMLEWLRTELKNYKIQLVTKLEEKPLDPEETYSNVDKYKKMNEKNPHLDDLRQQLGLELEL